MQGRIMRGVAGVYDILAEDGKQYECKPKGIFRNQKIKPLVGDLVSIEILNSTMLTGLIVEIKPRHSEIIRPAVANIDQAAVVFAAAAPEPNLNLLDRFLIVMACQQIETIICFNKVDLISEDKKRLLKDRYQRSGCKVLFLCAAQNEGISSLQSQLQDRITVLAGPSGVGKSTIVNLLSQKTKMETGKLSEKIQRGKHTTRYSQLIELWKGTYLFDTPGFSSLSIEDIQEKELKNYYAEFQLLEEQCKFNGCVHLNEPGCAVKEAVAIGKINLERYETYRLLYEELKSKRKY